MNKFNDLKFAGAALTVLAVLTGVARAENVFQAAADFSDLAFFEARGIQYEDGGQVKDGLEILKNHGINCVRLRLWTSDATQAADDPYNYTNNLAYTLPLAVRVKNAGLLFMLDFHYSDTWADPGHQTTPDAWTNFNLGQLVEEMRTYNSNTIATFAAAGAMPDYVQVGNEITQGMLWPLGKVSGSYNTSWSQLGQLMKAAIQGIQDASSAFGSAMPKIIVHIDRGGDWAGTMWFFDNLQAQDVPFDIIGESYYPFFHGPLANLSNCLTNAALRYGKPILVAETAFPWNDSHWMTNIAGFTPSTNGQVGFIVALAQIVKSLPHNLGTGIAYWGAEYQASDGVNEAGYETTSFFDSNGNVLPVADAMGALHGPLTLQAAIAGQNLVLQWPLSEAGWNLMTTTNLGPFTIWSPVTNNVQNTGLTFTVTLPLTLHDNSFYRLQSN